MIDGLSNVTGEETFQRGVDLHRETLDFLYFESCWLVGVDIMCQTLILVGFIILTMQCGVTDSLYILKHGWIVNKTSRELIDVEISQRMWPRLVNHFSKS